MATNPSNQRLSAYANPLSKLDPSWRNALQSPVVMLLIALLLAQLVAALVLAGKGLNRITSDETLLDISAQPISSVEITGDGAALRLQRSDDGWTLPDLGGFPADAGKVEQLITTLGELKRTLPVAASADARQRLKVADDNAAARIKLFADDGTTTELLTGDSPGFRRLYGRLAGEDAVFDLPLAAFEVSSDSDDWVIRDRLRLDAEAISRVAADDWILEKTTDGRWQLGDDTRELDPSEVEDLLRRIANLSYQGVAAAPADGLENEEPSLRLKITLEGGSTVERVIGRDEESGFLLRTGGEPFVYKLSEYDLEGVVDLDPDSLRVKAEPRPDAVDATAVIDQAPDTADDASAGDVAADTEAQQGESPALEEPTEPPAPDDTPVPAAVEDTPPAADIQERATEADPAPVSRAPDAEDPESDNAAAADHPPADTAQAATQAADAAPVTPETSNDTPAPAEPETPSTSSAVDEDVGVKPTDAPTADTAAQPASTQSQPVQSPLPRPPYQQPYAPPQPPPWPPQGQPMRPPPAGWR